MYIHSCRRIINILEVWEIASLFECFFLWYEIISGPPALSSSLPTPSLSCREPSSPLPSGIMDLNIHDGSDARNMCKMVVRARPDILGVVVHFRKHLTRADKSKCIPRFKLTLVSLTRTRPGFTTETTRTVPFSDTEKKQSLNIAKTYIHVY